MDIVGLHKLIDDWAAKQVKITVSEGTFTVPAETEVAPQRELPKNKRAVRTKQSGDRVYCLDEEKKTRAWVTNPEVLASLGFEASDVVEVDENELLKYNMSPAIYKVQE